MKREEKGKGHEKKETHTQKKAISSTILFSVFVFISLSTLVEVSGDVSLSELALVLLDGGVTVLALQQLLAVGVQVELGDDDLKSVFVCVRVGVLCPHKQGGEYVYTYTHFSWKL